MVKLSIPQKRMNKNELQDFLKDSIDKLDPQSIVKIQLEGEVSKECIPLFRAASLRALCPKDMNISVKFF
jgi:hypothetical protein